MKYMTQLLSFHIAELIIPLAGGGILLAGLVLIGYMFAVWKKELYFAAFLVILVGFVFIVSEALITILGTIMHHRPVSFQFNRLQHVAASWFLFAYPFFLGQYLRLGSFLKKATTVVSLAGLTLAVLITTVAFIRPDWYVSVSFPPARAAWDNGAWGRGAEGFVYSIRDASLALVILYSAAVTVISIIRFEKDRQKKFDVIVILVGILCAIFGAADDTVGVYTGTHIGLFPSAFYQRFPTGLMVCIILICIALSRRFILQAREVESAWDQLNASEERFLQIAGGIDEVFWLLERESGVLRCVYVNHAFSKVWQRSAKMVSDSFDNWFATIHEADRSTVRALLETMEPGDTKECEYRILLPFGEIRWIRDKITALFGATKGQIVRLARISEDVTLRKSAEIQLQYMAYQDGLTGLYNRKSFFMRLGESIAQAARSSDKLRGLLFIDMDNFKYVNDSYGHSTGDILLKRAAELLQQGIRKSDILCRFGDDEFIIILNTLSEEIDAAIVAEKLLKLFSEPFMVDDNRFFLGCSIGISLYPHDGQDPETLLKKADAALFEAKKARNSYYFFTQELQDLALEKMEIAAELRNALKKNELMVYYQPQVGFDGRLTGAEALVRWNSERWGFVPPSKFIPIAEESGLIHQIGDWVIDRACADFSEGREDVNGLSVSVNLSMKQFLDRDFNEKLFDAVKRAGYTPDKLNLELTESIFSEDFALTVVKLNKLKNAGFSIEIDDFGTGYSSLRYLDELPIDTLKIDRSFIMNLPDNAKQVALVNAISAMARSLGLKIIAEGVETDAQFKFLQGLGNRGGVQGFLFSQALPHDKFSSFVAGFK